ncbi:MAG: WbqC family protein, partial [Candidatus Omnitrophica bacterium]|nr:WbqC family protein [Candidatus Omnitrophota bacterium]
KIRNADSWQWLTVPVRYEFGQRISEVMVDDSKGWREKHLKSLEMSYSRAPSFREYFPAISEIIMKKSEMLVDISTELIEYFLVSLGISKRIVKSSTLGISTVSTERLVDICVKLGADTYVSGPGGEEYLDERVFARPGIKLEYQRFRHPEYRQVFRGFEPNMAVVDLIFSEGQKSMSIIRSGREE